MSDSAKYPGHPLVVLWLFLRLGLTSFGGPVAHIGYFRDEFVARRRWLSDADYAALVALCQFLPGPASSQVGMALGLKRAGLAGMLAAWCGFTLPSVLIMVLAGYGVLHLGDNLGGGLAGLKAATVAIVAHATWSMGRTLVPDAPRASMALLAALMMWLTPWAWIQLLVIALGAVMGYFWLSHKVSVEPSTLQLPVAPHVSSVAVAILLLLLLGLPWWVDWDSHGVLALLDHCVRAGALVFGGGHVVLPLLQGEMVDTGLVDESAFLAGYGVAQVVPGPLFTFASYLGVVNNSEANGLLGAAVATLGVFLPAALLVLVGVSAWQRLRSYPATQGALAGINATVVGLLAATLYQPVFSQGVTGSASMALVAASFVTLHYWRLPVWVLMPLACGLGHLFLG